VSKIYLNSNIQINALRIFRILSERWFAKRFLHPSTVAPYDYVFLWDEDLGVDNFTAEPYVLPVIPTPCFLRAILNISPGDHLNGLWLQVPRHREEARA
jgi:hypothetical protein